MFSRGSEGNTGQKRVKLVLKLLLNSKSFTISGLNTTRTQEKLDNPEKIIFFLSTQRKFWDKINTNINKIMKNGNLYYLLL